MTATYAAISHFGQGLLSSAPLTATYAANGRFGQELLSSEPLSANWPRKRGREPVPARNHTVAQRTTAHPSLGMTVVRAGWRPGPSG
jgi:hypothetical protein